MRVNCCPEAIVVPEYELASVVIVLAGVTVKTVVPLTPLLDAWTVAVPVFSPVARPLALIVAALLAGFTLHVTPGRGFSTIPPVKVPLALNCCVPPTAIVGLDGNTWIDCNVAVPVLVPSR